MSVTVDSAPRTVSSRLAAAREDAHRAEPQAPSRTRTIADVAGAGSGPRPTQETSDVALRGTRAQEAFLQARLLDRVGPRAERPVDPATVAARPVDPPPGSVPPHVQGVLDIVENGAVDDASRAALAARFQGMTVAQSHEAMDAIRDRGLLGTFLDQTLRDASGKAVDPRIRAGVKEMMETGRLDAYAESLATTSYNLHDPATSGRLSDPHYQSGGIYFTEAHLAAPTGELAKTMAHETYHAFAAAHGGSTYSALDEGMGIAAIHHAFSDQPFSMAEAVYGTANFYRDYNLDPNYPLGTMAGADPKLRELVGLFDDRDTSGLAWNAPRQLAAEYQKFWEPYSRSEDLDGNGVPDWFGPGGYAERAEAAMLAARRAKRMGPRPTAE